ncbi:16S rRNA methyltransferase [Corynebacterium frankenforstense DSM 45800]|uniref:Ribosomal RNA small subunit methyltransferase E n=1 Tax=Corynebacterium frankenforstense DSM 45800 TaxID=1437875 RepID=A0A1L7CTY5_9CORY|nr:16S rRNA (uracil(1498)-N(3))-methyltransferase [Corynebacterium frankenforstense]APT89314.1 16S rRNA methyltransferase [Corynebacterium frankenforstense DSM 45800]
MSLPVFLLDAPLAGEPPRTVELTGPEGRHAVTVRRITPGEHVELVDGAGVRLRALVTAVHGKDRLVCEVEEAGVDPAPVPEVTVVQAIPKSPHADLAVDLLTQAGADEIVAWEADRCVARWSGKPGKAEKALGKWADRAREAGKQARRARLPRLSGPVDTHALVGNLAQAGEETVVAVLHESATRPLRELPLDDAARVVLLVGPEGGIGDDELGRLRQAGAQPVRLGPEVARASSAGALALAAVGALTGRW